MNLAILAVDRCTGLAVAVQDIVVDFLAQCKLHIISDDLLLGIFGICHLVPNDIPDTGVHIQCLLLEGAGAFDKVGHLQALEGQHIHARFRIFGSGIIHGNLIGTVCGGDGSGFGAVEVYLALIGNLSLCGGIEIHIDLAAADLDPDVSDTLLGAGFHGSGFGPAFVSQITVGQNRGNAGAKLGHCCICSSFEDTGVTQRAGIFGIGVCKPGEQSLGKIQFRGCGQCDGGVPDLIGAHLTVYHNKITQGQCLALLVGLGVDQKRTPGGKGRSIDHALFAVAVGGYGDIVDVRIRCIGCYGADGRNGVGGRNILLVVQRSGTADDGSILRPRRNTVGIPLGNGGEAAVQVADYREGIGEFLLNDLFQLALAELYGRTGLKIIVVRGLGLICNGAGGGHQRHDAHDPDHQRGADGHNEGQRAAFFVRAAGKSSAQPRKKVFDRFHSSSSIGLFKGNSVTCIQAHNFINYTMQVQEKSTYETEKGNFGNSFNFQPEMKILA